MSKWNEFKGKEVKDKITGFQGLCTGQTRWLYGCNQYLITPKVNEKKEIGKGEWFDEGRIEVIGEGIQQEEVLVEKNGGCDNYAVNSRR